ncbi:FAD-binding oxidoreductase [Aspergillus aculeatinus CBS 121060]|uniref:FAD-binding domain-containing protein n=1 Tax=Aspergillus aculeatinus CBS 121060 TaxID=1448322 RepID=A0ACD1H4L2_9EURO|nr:FAD-binding domain-containing protein [Aspergillus aculeatinus CBS 121060]RAH68513.1 FAD-binding domain-containing protein [Aspergillus aculeatinus CBS 121060]
MASVVLYAAGAVGLWAAARFYHQQPATNPTACNLLSSQLQGLVSLTHSPGYNESIGSFFSYQEQNVHPACVVRPTSAQDVSIIVETMAVAHRERGEQFAIRSGGHGLFAGAANIQDGVTVDLRSMSTVEVSSDRATVQIGAGARWLQVYQVLDPLNITVTGGRDAAIGAGGFLTGGGIGVPSVTAGWGCDDVLEYEIVVASGEILRVSADRHPDLFVALKGGSSNFGVVTRFTMRTHPLGKLWAGFTAYPGTEAPRLLAAYSDFMEPANLDPHADLIESYGWTSKHAAVHATLIMLYAQPRPYPAVYQNLINNSTVLYNTLRVTNMSDFVIEEDSYQVPGFSTMYYTTTFAHDPAVYSAIFDLYNKSVASISVVKHMNWYISFQPTPSLHARNSLGLDPADNRLVIFLLVAFFPDPSDAELVHGTAMALIEAIEGVTKDAGVYRPFKYMNYADAAQDVIGGYGEESVAALRRTSRKYDPEGLFQTGVPGGFKLFV